MNYAQIRHYDTANGIGIRTSIFFSGCTHNCYNCFNKEYQCFSYGNKLTDKEINIISQYLKEDEIHGLTLLGGEPLQQNFNDMIYFLEKIKTVCDEKNKDIWVYSGYTYEEILYNNERKKILSYCDILVDGRYEEKLKNLRLKFRGSSNQRIIDIKLSLKTGNIAILEDYLL